MFLSGYVIEIKKIFNSIDHISSFLSGYDLFMTHYENGYAAAAIYQ